MARESLGEVEQLVLLAILRLGDDAYGVPIVEEIEQTHVAQLRLEDLAQAQRDVGVLGGVRHRLLQRDLVEALRADGVNSGRRQACEGTAAPQEAAEGSPTSDKRIRLTSAGGRAVPCRLCP